MSSFAIDRVPQTCSLSLVAAALLGLATAGCAPALGQRTAPPVSFTCASAQQCRVPVEVDCTTSPCKIVLSNQFQNVDSNGFGVVWEIAQKPGQSYAFGNPGGIFFKTQEGQQAYNCHAEANGKRFSCQGNRNGKTYEYGIELTGSPPVSKLDPWIVNR